MALMKAFQLVEWGHKAEFVDVPVPAPRPDEVLVRMRGAGLCRSDLDIMEAAPGEEPYASVLPAGFTLGHENAGIVEMLGSSVTDLKVGEGVVVHHMHSCGHCDFCLGGIDQHCQTYARGAVSLTRGLGLDGGLAQFLVVPRHELVSIGSIDPVDMAPLTDAGVTAYHAVQKVLNVLKPGAVAVVIGIGGLGTYGIQFLKLLTSAEIIALDVSEARRTAGIELGARHVLASDETAAERILELTRGNGADAVIDFVGSNETLALAARISRPQGRIILVGMAGGHLNFGWGTLATSCEVAISMGSTRADLSAVCKLAAAGRLTIEKQTFAFDDVQTAYDLLKKGQLHGRGVIAFD